MILGHCIQLDPTRKQATYFKKAAGTARFAWNWGLAVVIECLDNNKSFNVMKLRKEFNAIKGTEFPWIYDIGKDCSSQPFMFLQRTLTRYFKEKRENKPDRIGFPNFKTRDKHSEFYISSDKLTVLGNQIRVPRLGWVKMTECLRYEGHIKSATISRSADKWFVSFNVEVKDFTKSRTGDAAIGVDLGLTTFATLSTGEKIDAPKPLKKNLKKLARANRELARKQKGSKNYDHALLKLQKVHYDVANVRKDFLHKLSTRLCRENQAIMVENLNIAGLMKNSKLARAISDAGWGEFRRQLKYKCAVYDNDVVIVDRWFPSSKLCSDCGFKNGQLKLKDRIWTCKNCEETHDRDINAALNLLHTGGYSGTVLNGNALAGWFMASDTAGSGFNKEVLSTPAGQELEATFALARAV
jgi:putative transposase